ncbi:MAG: uracil-DNA glycosylase [Deltaproteobacteria bacterium]|nr:uracil-DNA glycosylase [Deltaproteobacteria bacterium]
MTQREFLSSILDDTLHALRDLAEKGSRGFDCSEHSLSVLNSWKRISTEDRRHICRLPPATLPEPPEPVTVSVPCETVTGSGDLSVSALADPLESIQTDIGDCQRCKLAQHRTHIVFGEGCPSARLMFVGEAPGFDEDQQGMPFVGKAGQLLSRIIQAINLTREQVYICNVIKCRPPGNRNPEPDEILACSPFLNRQIASIRPEFICALGTFAAQTLLKTTRPISKLRSQFYDYNGIRLLPTFHPSYLLRNPDKKREVWEDMKLLMNEMTL